jgi:hypothetical protein
MTPVVRHSLFNAGDDLDLPTAPFARRDGAASGSMLNTRLSLCIQVIDWWRSAGVLSSQLSPVC